MRVCSSLRIGHCGVPGGAVVANTLPPMFCDAAGKDPAGSNACDGGAGNKDGGEFSGGEEEGDVEDPFVHRIVLQLSPQALVPLH
jgi:hypothetical protein